MVVYEEATLDAVFRALGDSTRRRILMRLRDGDETSASELAAPFPMSLPGVTKHLRSLQRAGLVVHRKKGRERLYRLRPESLRLANHWLDEYEAFWNAQLDALDAYVKQAPADEA